MGGAGGGWAGDDGSADEVLGMGKERGLICKGNEIITARSAVLTRHSPTSWAGRVLEGAALGAPSTPAREHSPLEQLRTWMGLL